MPMLLENELEFFIETNSFVAAERALQMGQSLLVFLRQEAVLGPDPQIRLSHLGQGSLIARLMVKFRDPSISNIAAVVGASGTVVAAVFAGIAALKAGDSRPENGRFPENVAEACIESNARRCGFRVGTDEFFIERDEMPAIRQAEDRIRSGAPASLPPAGYAYIMNGQAYTKEGEQFAISRTTRQSDIAPPRTQQTAQSALDDRHGPFEGVATIFESGNEPNVWANTPIGRFELQDYDAIPDLGRRGVYRIKGVLDYGGETIAIETAYRMADEHEAQQADSIFQLRGQLVGNYDPQHNQIFKHNHQLRPVDTSEEMLKDVPKNTDVDIQATVSADNHLWVLAWKLPHESEWRGPISNTRSPPDTPTASSSDPDHSLAAFLRKGLPFPWDAPAQLYLVADLARGARRRRADLSGVDANGAIAAAMSGAHGNLNNVEIVIESGPIILQGNDIARAAALPGRI